MLNWAIGIDMYTLMCIKLITNENRLYSTWNSTQLLCVDLNGKEIQGRGDKCVRVADSLCCTAETNTTL